MEIELSGGGGKVLFDLVLYVKSRSGKRCWEDESVRSVGNNDFKSLGEQDVSVFVSQVMKDDIGDERMGCVLLGGFGEFGSVDSGPSG